jgi:hypothetical protein
MKGERRSEKFFKRRTGRGSAAEDLLGRLRIVLEIE